MPSNLALRLIELNANVVVTVRHLRPDPIIRLLDKESSLPDIELLDLSDFTAVQNLCNRHRVDTIFHLAATTIAREAARAPISTLKNNLRTTFNILEVARINEIKRVLIASTDKVYGQ